MEQNFRPAAKANPAFAVRNIYALFVALEKAETRCVWDEALAGVRRFYAHDLWGNRLEFTEPATSSPISSQGAGPWWQFRGGVDLGAYEPSIG
jgi:hypothetical protein